MLVKDAFQKFGYVLKGLNVVIDGKVSVIKEITPSNSQEFLITKEGSLSKTDKIIFTDLSTQVLRDRFPDYI